MNASTSLFRALAAFALLFIPAALHAQGTFPPPSGPTTPVMKTLTQVEPRTAIPGGVPYTISTPGSYYLTGNIAITAGSTAAITINASNVTLDLNGFTLSGSGTGNGGSVDYGIVCTGQSNVVIRNGNIRLTAYGIYLGVTSTARGVRIESVTMSQHGFGGIVSETPIAGFFISRCSVNTVNSSGYANSANLPTYGISTYAGACVEGCFIDNVKAAGASRGYGISLAGIAVSRNNTVMNCDCAFENGKVTGNTTNNCTITYLSTVDGGGNN